MYRGRHPAPHVHLVLLYNLLGQVFVRYVLQDHMLQTQQRVSIVAVEHFPVLREELYARAAPRIRILPQGSAAAPRATQATAGSQ